MKQYVKEKWFGIVQPYYDTTLSQYDIFVNPTMKETREVMLQDESGYDHVRFIADSEYQNLWVFNTSVLHKVAAEKIYPGGYNEFKRRNEDGKIIAGIAELKGGSLEFFDAHFSQEYKKYPEQWGYWIRKRLQKLPLPKIKEALTPDDQREILSIEGNILGLKRDLLDAEGDAKENIKSRMDALKKRISDIKDRAKDESFVAGTEKFSRYFEIFKNPSKKEVISAINQNIGYADSVRFIADVSTKDLYIFPSDLLHGHAAEQIYNTDPKKIYDENKTGRIFLGIANFRSGKLFLNRTYSNPEESHFQFDWDWLETYMETYGILKG